MMMMICSRYHVKVFYIYVDFMFYKNGIAITPRTCCVNIYFAFCWTLNFCTRQFHQIIFHVFTEQKVMFHWFYSTVCNKCSTLGQCIMIIQTSISISESHGLLYILFYFAWLQIERISCDGRKLLSHHKYSFILT